MARCSSGKLGSGQAHVATETDTKLCGRLARQLAKYACEAATDRKRRLAVNLLAVEAAGVVCLEDAWMNSHEAAILKALRREGVLPPRSGLWVASSFCRVVARPSFNPKYPFRLCQDIPSGPRSSTRRPSSTRVAASSSRSWRAL